MFSEENVERIKAKMVSMKGWLKFLAIMNIILGIGIAFSIVGIIVAWVPIWIGILLLEASGQIDRFQYDGDPESLIRYLDKLRLYFLLRGILIVVSLIFWAVAIIIALSEGGM